MHAHFSVATLYQRHVSAMLLARHFVPTGWISGSALTSMKPWMKFFGSVEPLGSSSARKYLSTCVSCFQKFKVSCCISISSACSCPSRPCVSCPVLSSPVYIPATVLQFFTPFIFTPLLLPPLLLPPLLFPPLLFPPLLLLPLLSPNRLYPSLLLFLFLIPPPLPPKSKRKDTHLKLLMTIKQQNIHRLQLIHISMPLKFLSNFGSNFRHGHIERIHGLDFRCLLYPHTHTYSDDQYSFFHVRIPHPSLPLPLLLLLLFLLSLFFLPPSIMLFQNQKKIKHTALNQSR